MTRWLLSSNQQTAKAFVGKYINPSFIISRLVCFTPSWLTFPQQLKLQHLKLLRIKASEWCDNEGVMTGQDDMFTTEITVFGNQICCSWYAASTTWPIFGGKSTWFYGMVFSGQNASHSQTMTSVASVTVVGNPPDTRLADQKTARSGYPSHCLMSCFMFESVSYEHTSVGVQYITLTSRIMLYL